MDLGFSNILQMIVAQQAKVTWPNMDPDYQIIGRKLCISDFLGQNGSIFNDSTHRKAIIRAVHDWLSLPENNNWLLIFDNVDDLESFQIENYFSKNSNGGRILITSRRPDFSQITDAADIDGLKPEEAITLLLKLTSRTINSDEQGMENAYMETRKLILIPNYCKTYSPSRSKGDN